METPIRESKKDGRRRFTSEEKKQLLANLDLEVAHRTRQFEETLAQALDNFMNHHEGQVLRVPKLVRSITMAEFADKYNGDINECLRGLQRDKQGGEPTLDPALRKRKWKDSEEPIEDLENRRASKTARFVSPVKMNAAKILKARLNKTPATTRTSRHAHPPSATPSKFTKPSLRFLSPTKASSSKTTSRVPSSSTFNPAIPKTPAYPRAPRKNENLLSVNGSPVSYPSNFEDALNDGGEEERPTLRKQKSIVIRKNPSFNFARDKDSSDPSTQPSKLGLQTQRSRSPTRVGHSSSGSGSSASSVPSVESFVSKPSALIRVPTKDGLILEFDPMLSTPDELDSLEGITDDAKRQAREDMTLLVQETLARWKL
ncbi:Nbl1 borealin amino-terminal [Pyrrhoderma noxium]|uniref:Nbl1 borealin amino-terminal n=1 Tax=Pyrrhoderma noxium TaxID=2282107 RepID=A0A286UCT2_9AGAM|nr:Nbl1 borealin amino-terminal [Pyrrhoderma noxium]